MGQAQINVRTRACSRTSVARTKQAALTHNVRGKELKNRMPVMRDFQTWLITQVTAARGAACQFPSELPVCPGCSVYNSQAAEQVIQAT